MDFLVAVIGQECQDGVFMTIRDQLETSIYMSLGTKKDSKPHQIQYLLRCWALDQAIRKKILMKLRHGTIATCHLFLISHRLFFEIRNRICLFFHFLSLIMESQYAQFIQLWNRVAKTENMVSTTIWVVWFYKGKNYLFCVLLTDLADIGQCILVLCGKRCA